MDGQWPFQVITFVCSYSIFHSVIILGLAGCRRVGVIDCFFLFLIALMSKYSISDWCLKMSATSFTIDEVPLQHLDDILARSWR